MKLVFDARELDYLGVLTEALFKVAAEQDDLPWAAPVSRLRYKLTPNASFVNLKAAERKLLAHLLDRRAVQLEGTVGAERDTVKQLQRKLAV